MTAKSSKSKRSMPKDEPQKFTRMQLMLYHNLPASITSKIKCLAIEEKRIGAVSLDSIPCSQFLDVYKRRLKDDILPIEYKVRTRFYCSIQFILRNHMSTVNNQAIQSFDPEKTAVLFLSNLQAFSLHDIVSYSCGLWLIRLNMLISSMCASSLLAYWSERIFDQFHILKSDDILSTKFVTFI